MDTRAQRRGDAVPPGPAEGEAREGGEGGRVTDQRGAGRGTAQEGEGGRRTGDAGRGRKQLWKGGS